MKKHIIALVICLLSFLTLSGQDKVYQSSISNNRDTISFTVDVKTDNVKLPIADVESISKRIEDLKANNTTEFSALQANLNSINSKIDNIVYKESDAKVEYIAANFNMTKDNINKAIRRSSAITLVATIIPFLLLFVLWWRLYIFRRLNAADALIFTGISLVVGLATGLLIKFGLEAIFNSDMAVLRELQKLL